MTKPPHTDTIDPSDSAPATRSQKIEDAMTDQAGWHLDRKVPISIIGALLFQTVLVVWFIGKIDSRIIALETANIVQRERDDRQDKAAIDAAALIRDDIRQLSSKLDRLIERRP